ncbi:hypothetical protein ACP275_13G189500 [Erythranthe tilingii]
MKFYIRVNMVLHKFGILRFFASFRPSAITFPFSCRLEICLPMSVECEFLSFSALSPSLPLCCKSDLFIHQFASADSKCNSGVKASCFTFNGVVCRAKTICDLDWTLEKSHSETLEIILLYLKIGKSGALLDSNINQELTNCRGVAVKISQLSCHFFNRYKLFDKLIISADFMHRVGS